MATVFYIKEGRKYVPIREYDSDLMSSFSYGATLVVMDGNLTKYRHKVDIDYASLIAAGMLYEELLIRALDAASEARPKEAKKLTAEQKAAWDHFIETMGDDARYISYPAMADIARSTVKALHEKAKEIHQHPVLKDALDSYIALCKLTLSGEECSRP